ncbi:alanyl-tRNA editing protein [Acuticoccus sp. I52.16.1]|uniref:alanyl-tRNA editing protein n=1 Tax=Acuticoccus sp. I52.16.1 TaxID=2928472 RepID=UPI001FD51E6C|nr:alanyl-tRNA editing protein [Acuticoccus sp. I52.16.1]UOM35719.1 alanyl-tRNA editing protein [Acuticoccus sp. I52.16.1]
MTTPLFRDDPYLERAEGRVVEVGDGWVVLDQALLYAAGGGQPGDTGSLMLADGTQLPVTDAQYGDDREVIRLMVAAPPPVGTVVTQHLDFARRLRLMRMHTALHLLSVALPFPVTGGQIGADGSRLDFDMPESPDKDALTATVQEMIDGDHAVTTEWITDAELDANPDLVKTMKVKPPRGSGRVRLVRIGDVDLQPCGGTHVATTGEIGRVAVTKIEKKGRQNRRVRLQLVD